jgi:hypothetical protein
MDSRTSITNKGLRACPSPLDATLTENRGVHGGGSPSFPQLLPSRSIRRDRQCPPEKFWVCLSKIAQLSGFSAHNMHLSTARTREIARYARLGRAVSLLSPLFLFRAFYCAVQSQLNQIEESLHRLHDYQRVSLFSGIFLGLCLYSYHVRELLACWFFFCLLFALVALLILGGLLASHAAKYVMDWTNAGRPPRLVAGIDPVKLQELPERLENSTALLSAETGLQTPV